MKYYIIRKYYYNNGTIGSFAILRYDKIGPVMMESNPKMLSNIMFVPFKNLNLKEIYSFESKKEAEQFFNKYCMESIKSTLFDDEIISENDYLIMEIIK